MASIYLPPIARKKKVEGWPRQDSTRVFSDYVQDSKKETTSYGSHFVRHNVPPTPQRAFSPSRKNKPQPTAVTFLTQNPRFVCEPICHVNTSVSKAFQSWWPNEIIERPVVKPQYTLHSTSRTDYRTLSHDCQTVATYSKFDASTRKVFKHDYNIGKFSENTSSQVMPYMAEKISYEHQFNSRLDPSHPVRGRRHGCFVWKTTAPVFKTYHGKYPKSKSVKDKKGEFKDSKNTDTMDNSDAKSVISTITDGSQVMEQSDPHSNNSKKSELIEHKIKDNAWTSITNQNNHQPAIHNDMVDLNEAERENMIKPSQPRCHYPPPHVI